MKLKSTCICNICGGEFVKSPVTIQKEGKKDRKILVLCCKRCGDTKFSTEQYIAMRYKNNT